MRMREELARLNNNLETLISILSSNKPEMRNNLGNLNETVLGLIVSAACSNPSAPAVSIPSKKIDGLQLLNIGGIRLADVMETHPDSTCISRIQYNLDDQTLRVTFKQSKKTYQYNLVPSYVYEEFISNKSLGRFHNLGIKGQYPCAQVA